MSKRRLRALIGRAVWPKVVVVAVLALVATMVSSSPVQARTAYHPGTAQKEPVVAGSSYQTKPVTAAPAPAWHPAAVTWPTVTTVDTSLPPLALRAMNAVGPTRVAGLPLTVDPWGPSSVGSLRVTSLSHADALKAGVKGILLRVSRTDGGAATGTAKMTVNYSGFRNAYGGDWASRLQLRVLPECALSTPAAPACQGTTVPTTNDPKAGTVTGVVNVAAPPATSTPAAVSRSAGSDAAAAKAAAAVAPSGGTVMALDAAPGGGSGSYSATSLAPSATWNAGGNTGDFSWSYPIRVPPSLGGPTPTIALAYSSSSVDGRMASTNSQPSWIGEGFDYSSGSIERRYAGCADDMGSGANNTVASGDLCWGTDNASLSMSGHAGELIKDGTDPNKWHLRSEDGTVVQRMTGGSNGDNDGEYWVVTTPDGTQYFFGSRAASNSALLEPVFGNHAGEPCHAATFAASSCTQAYRWQLDSVVDLHGNTMTYTYAKETNKYGRNNTPTDAVSYDRSAYLTKIEYGTRTDSSGSAPMQVLFTVADRCLSSCATKDAAHWPDVPWDQECAGTSCTPAQSGPSFWTTKRLTEIRTQVWNAATSAYRDVESWTLSQSFPDPTDSITPALWLDKISHTGLVGTTTTVPDVTFTGVVMPNRVDTDSDQFAAMNKFRIATITSESGGKINVAYSAKDCVAGTRVPDAAHLENNVLRCYPVRWTPAGHTTPITDFFHKYLVTDVSEADLTGSTVPVLTHYDYLGDPAWHFTDEDGFTKAAEKTYSVWRGYGAVKTTKGAAGEQTSTETRYFRGMNGDTLPGGGTRSVSLPAITIGSVPAAVDEDPYAGMPRETITYNGPGGAEISATVSEPYESAPTATRTLNGVTVYARFTGVKTEHTRTTLDGGRPARTTSKVTTFDAYGMPTQVDDHGDDAVSGDEQCTLTGYVRNTAINLLTPVSREQTFAVGCTAALAGGLGDDDVIGDTKTSYDQLAWNATPTKGDSTKTETMKTYNSGNPTYVTASTSTFDAYGRPLTSVDIRGGTTTTAYTPPTGGPLTMTTETSPLGWVKTTADEPAWGSPTTMTDVNGRKIDLAYDGLGRLTQVWLAGRDKATQTPNIVYTYLIRNNAATVVTTQRLNAAGGYITSYKLFDNLLRERQTQDSDGAGGANAVVADTYYDSAGRAYKTHDPYLSNVPPSTDLFLPTGTIPSQRVMMFDGAGREIQRLNQINAPPASPGGTTTSSTITGYSGGDRTDVTPPLGGTATSTITSATGKTTEFRQYHIGYAAGSTDPAGYDRTSYSYDRKDQLTRITDAAGHHWDYTYDLQGRQTVTIDPDKGTATTTYNDAGDVVTATDARNQTIADTYDLIGRRTTLRSGSVTGPLLAEWDYDTLANGVHVNGQLFRTIRYVGTDQYTKEFTAFTADYKPSSAKYVIPASETGLAGTYTYVYTYNQDGSPATLRVPAAGDLALETLTDGYNAQGKATTLSTSLGSTYVTGTDYTSFNEVGAIHLRNNGGNQVDVVRTYETDTRRLAQIWTTKQTSPTTIADVRYTYDQAGNVTKVADLTAADTQCFTTDYLTRMTEAWTPSSGDCTAAPTVAGLGGPAKYWQSYSYDTSGSRTQLVDHGTATGDRTTNYTVPAAVHELAGTSTTDNNGTTTAAYTYDESGNVKTRPSANGTQTLTWDAEQHLATATDSTGTTSYIYDNDGQRLVRRDPTGKTLYLPGEELRFTTASGAKNCTRYYTHLDETVALRTSAGVTWLATDQHGTASISVSAVSQAVAQRRETPFGQLRQSTGTWNPAYDKGFVGGTNDNTGLTHLGAREYDPVIGRFISVDPVVDSMDPQQLHGYAYADNAPVTASDINGMWPSWLNKAVNTVSHAVSQAATSVAQAAVTAGKWVYDNAGTISTVTGIAAAVCSVIPPLQVLAPALTAISTITGAIDTYKTCKQGVSLDCAMGVVSLIPGGRAVGEAEKGAKAAKKGIDAAEDVEDAAKAGRKGFSEVEDACMHSFEPATAVLMADGTTKPIRAVAVGDRVVSTDPATGRQVDKTVTTLHHNDDLDLTDLRVKVAGAVQTLKTTWQHPFWDATSHGWVAASRLVAGHQLKTADGSTVTVVDVRNYFGDRWMDDLTVADLHTYYVLAGATPVLVHNCKARVDGPLPDRGQTSLYALHNPQTGEILKWGISKNPLKRYSCDELEGLGARMQIIKNFDTKFDALMAERFMYKRWPGMLNHERSAGSIAPSGTWQDGLNHIRSGRLFD